MSASNQILTEGSLPQRRKGAKRYRVTNGPSLRLCAFAREILFPARAFLVLAKPEITLMVMISAGVASLLAADSFRFVVVAHTVLGTGLLAAGVAALNQYLERDVDSRMRRTARRPLPAEQLTPGQALTFGVAVSVSGMLYIFAFLNALTALLG